MSNTIQIKRRTSGSGTLASLLEGELGVDLTDSNKLYVGTSGGNQLLNPTSSGNLTSTGDFTIDSGDGIILDADGGAISLKDGGTRFGVLENSSSNFVIQNPIDDKDILFKIKDGRSVKTALTLDGSEDGNATFSGTVTASGGTLSGTLNIGNTGDEKIVLKNSNNPYVMFQQGTTNKGFIQWNAAYAFLEIANSAESTNLRLDDTLQLSLDGGSYYDVLTSNTGLLKTGGTLTGGLTLQESDGRSTLTLVGAKTADGNYGDILGSNNSGAGRAQISFRRISNDDATGILFYTEATGASMSESMRIDSNGVTSYNDITINSGNATLRLNDTTSGSNFNIFSNGSELRMAQHNATFPGAYLNLTTAGNLGLGVTGASERLEVSGKAIFTDAVSVGQSSAPSGNNKFEVYNTSGNYNAVFKNSGQATIEVKGGENSSARIRLIPDEGDDVNNKDHFQLIHETSNNFELQRYNTTSGWEWKWKLDSSNNVHQTGDLTVGGHVSLHPQTHRHS